MSGSMSVIGAFAIALFAVGFYGRRYLPVPKPKIVGIDLGTTFSSVGVYVTGTGEVTIVRDEDGRRIIPSVVALVDGKVLVGHPAVFQALLHPDATFYDSKRFIGRTVTMEEVDSLRPLYRFNLSSTNGSATFHLPKRIGNLYNFTSLNAEDIGAMLLRKMKQMAERHLGKQVDMAVISVPAEFDSSQREATVRAAAMAGLKVARIINEPTAAALAYGLDKKDGVEHVVVVDFGGGTLDVSLLSCRGGTFYTLGMAGINRLGGQDFTSNIFHYIVNYTEITHGVHVTKAEDLQRLHQVAEDVKINLSLSDSSVFSTNLNVLGDKQLFGTMDRATFEAINSHLFDKMLEPVKAVLEESMVTADQVDEVVLVGGSTRMPRVRSQLSAFFGREVNTRVDPDVAVATGVSIQAGIIGGSWPLRVAAVEIMRDHMKKILVS